MNEEAGEDALGLRGGRGGAGPRRRARMRRAEKTGERRIVEETRDKAQGAKVGTAVPWNERMVWSHGTAAPPDRSPRLFLHPRKWRTREPGF